MQPLTIVSLLAENARPLYRAVARYLSEHANLPARLVEGVPWQEQEHMLDTGAADVGFLCGLLYTQKTDHLAPLAAPVMAAPRYAGMPIYFSDVVVPAGSPFGRFADLRGARWLFNEPGSFSGYAVLRAHLAALGETGDFCGSMQASGGHIRSLEMVAAGEADAAAIDSTVLDLERARRPELVARVRTVAALGPHSIPPVAVARHVPPAVQEQLRAALLGMHTTEAGRQALALGQVARFVAVHDIDYNDVRATANTANQIVFRPQ
jgi:phosphonate transport system substrate-binding protein